MRLSDYILSNIEPILVEWEAFALSVWPDKTRDPVRLRDHAADILRATANDMKSAQTDSQQSDKSKGDGDRGRTSDRVDGASDIHAVGRVRSGFDLLALVAEYRALRASVIRLWRESLPEPDRRDLEDLTRFNESIDQSLTEAIRSFSHRMDQSRQMFLAILGHDLRNPLTSIMLSSAALPRLATLDPVSTRIAAQILDSAKAMGSMINDLLDFTGSRLGVNLPVSRRTMDLSELCQSVVGEMRAAHPKRTLNFTPDGDLKGEWDGARLRQVISNLLGNAMQHGAENTEVAIHAMGDGENVLLSVSNSGTPIPAELLPTIFEPLVRDVGQVAGKPRRPGSIGLGLYIAREVVTVHGGTIDVKSTEQAGTVFTVKLPRRSA
jgi:signal transduction histidine kinase